MNIVGITGKKFHGKDTTAGFFEEAGYASAKFAGPLKRMLFAYYESVGLDDDEQIIRRIEGDLKEVPDPYLAGRTPRYAMQTLGTAWGRELMAEDFWLQALGHSINGFDNVVVSDCRFPNEADYIRGLGGRIVKVVREDMPDNESSAHASETEIDKIVPDAIIRNDGISLQTLRRSVQALLQSDAEGV